ncbi:hypothetical protein E1286_27555 [Nonomuraea terrae]|uniref:Uncharacterized protein n=1 Tax=Nonomuraea terrae TaxID=2530383 RepID=A0A4R4YL68_9ACTN|nr:hypothetical protein [Nonomuraea terrae]TDD44192.1 hypothetical protein E1286_27555 [Nonomuraea terrae]
MLQLGVGRVPGRDQSLDSRLPRSPRPAHALAALRQNYGTAAVDLKPHLAPHVIEQILDTRRAEGRRLTARKFAQVW